MTTTVNVKVGATNTPLAMDYTSFLTAIDACPADLTAVDQIWIANLYNQGTLTISSAITWTAVTDSNRYVKVTAAAGASFYENGTGALRYNNSHGVALEGTPNGILVTTKINNFNLSKIQVRASGSSANAAWEISTTTGNTGSDVVTIDQCIFSATVGGSNHTMAVITNSVGYVQNCLFVLENTNNNSGAYYNIASIPMINCTFVLPSNLSNTGTHGINGYGSPTMKNCAIFGFASPIITHDNVATTNIATDQATILGSPANSLTSVAYTTATFVQPSAAGGAVNSGGALDLRLVSGSALIGAGTSTGAPFYDILNNSRVSVANDLGTFQYNVPPAGTNMVINIL